MENCNHQCTGNCRRVGCNCECGEWHHVCEGLKGKDLEVYRKAQYWRGFKAGLAFVIVVAILLFVIVN